MTPGPFFPTSFLRMFVSSSKTVETCFRVRPVPLAISSRIADLFLGLVASFFFSAMVVRAPVQQRRDREEALEESKRITPLLSIVSGEKTAEFREKLSFSRAAGRFSRRNGVFHRFWRASRRRPDAATLAKSSPRAKINES